MRLLELEWEDEVAEEHRRYSKVFIRVSSGLGHGAVLHDVEVCSSMLTSTSLREVRVPSTVRVMSKTFPSSRRLDKHRNYIRILTASSIGRAGSTSVVNNRKRGCARTSDYQEEVHEASSTQTSQESGHFGRTTALSAWDRLRSPEGDSNKLEGTTALSRYHRSGSTHIQFEVNLIKQDDACNPGSGISTVAFNTGESPLIVDPPMWGTYRTTLEAQVDR